MYFLALDTATNSGGVALGRNAEVVGLSMFKAPLEYSERILSQVDFVLESFDLQIEDIGCFVVASGPGSFTGLRIGLATVKAFCQSLGKPGIAISTLEALAYRFRQVSGRVAPMVDARRQQVFGAVYDVAEGSVRQLDEEVVLPPADWLKRLPAEPCLLVGDAAQMYASTASALRPSDRVLRSDNSILTELCQLGYYRFIRGESSAPGDLKANYVRPSDARLSTDDSSGES